MIPITRILCLLQHIRCKAPSVSSQSTLFLSALLFFIQLTTIAQAQSAPELINMAGRAAGEGRYAEAAQLYEKAAALKNDRPEWLYQAAEHYYRARDYRRATICYEKSKGELSKSELSGLRYARSLKQEGRYQEAYEAFRDYAARYEGSRKAQVLTVVANELNGCELGIRLRAEADSLHIHEEAISLLPASINADGRESAPLLWRDDVLYFTRLKGGQSSLWRSSRRLGQWQAPLEARGFPASVAPRFGSGSFSPDGNRFYCTLCEELPVYERNAPGLRQQCELYLLRKGPEGWNEPERLRDYINLPDQTILHPFVLHEKGTEYLFFSSNRDGGLGGMDIYISHRPLDSDSLDFSIPQNMGPRINSAGDDISPFFDVTEQTLWFSSNGHPGIGGLDIYKSRRSAERWLPAAHAGLPINSAYDDYFFTVKKNADALLVSNRPLGNARTRTTDDDFFEFFPKKMPQSMTELTVGRALDSLDGKTAAPVLTDQSKPKNYLICLEVQPDFDPVSARYDAVRAWGTLSAMPMPEQGLQRILIGSFSDYQYASKLVAQVKSSGAFPTAFVVRQ